MRIREPIFINGFGRGGTNILMNLLLSHPMVCIATGETHRVFKGGEMGGTTWGLLRKRLCYDLPLRIASRQDVFRNTLLEPRRVPTWCDGFIDWVFHREKLRARHETHNKYKGEGEEYSDEEVARARLLTKGLNGVIHVNEVFRRMYPDAVYFGLVRSGLALCEGYTRRGVPVANIARIYANVAEKMLDYQESLPGFHLVRFEELIADPLGQMRDVYEKARLDISEVSRVRLQVKRVMTEDGEHRLAGGGDRQVVWYEMKDLGSHFSTDVDRIQVQRLDPRTRERFLSIAGNVMERLGYLT
jgi:hypothetical protein